MSLWHKMWDFVRIWCLGSDYDLIIVMWRNIDIHSVNIHQLFHCQLTTLIFFLILPFICSQLSMCYLHICTQKIKNGQFASQRLPGFFSFFKKMVFLAPFPFLVWTTHIVIDIRISCFKYIVNINDVIGTDFYILFWKIK